MLSGRAQRAGSKASAIICAGRTSTTIISFQATTALNNALRPQNSKLQYPPQNLVVLVWSEKPQRIREITDVQPNEYTGSGEKLTKLGEWIKQQRPAMPSYSKLEPKPSQILVGTLISNLSIGTRPAMLMLSVGLID